MFMIRKIERSDFWSTVHSLHTTAVSKFSVHDLIQRFPTWVICTLRGAFEVINRRENIFIYYSFIFMVAFPPGRIAGAPDPEGLGIPHGQQQFQVILLTPHYDRTNQGRTCGHSTWFLDDLLAAFPWVWQQTCYVSLLWGILDTRPNRIYIIHFEIFVHISVNVIFKKHCMLIVKSVYNFKGTC